MNYIVNSMARAGIMAAACCILHFTAVSQSRISGEYLFRQHEMVAGFRFDPAGTFDFFFSYGAVDRTASGRFTISGDTLRLQSDKEPGKDFTVTKQLRAGTGYTLRFDCPNRYLVKDIRCLFFVKGTPREVFTDEDGTARLPEGKCDSIFVQHGLFPDIVTRVKDAANSNNCFKLILNPSLEKVSFKGIDLKIENDSTLTCLPNYLLDLPEISFTRE